jgi:hypothetical protein
MSAERMSGDNKGVVTGAQRRMFLLFKLRDGSKNAPSCLNPPELTLLST